MRELPADQCPQLDELRAETQRLSEEESGVSESESSPGNDVADADTSEHQAFVFGYRSCDVDLKSLHPLPSQIPYMWQVFQENVDPLIKVLHIPTMNKLIRQIRHSLDSLTPPTEALMFAIYYAATISLDDDEVKTNFMAEKSVLVGQYRFAVEQALARAEFLTSSDMTTLQAFLLFLVLVRRNNDTRFAWTLTGLAIRIAHSVGLHRDGTNFSNLSVFEVEMRRRLWWAICIVDLRAAEDQGTDLNIIDRTFDTQFPLNINDADIDNDSTTFPAAREGPSDMTFSLIRYEICSLARRLHTASTVTGAAYPSDAASSLEERERMIREVYARVENKYLKHSSSEGNPIYWVAANIARVIVSKMTLVVYQPVLFPTPGNENLAIDIRDRLFTAATEIFEYNHLLSTDPRTGQWRWLFQTYTQWHALAYILMEMLRRPWSASVERGWAALNSVFSNLKYLDIEKMLDNTAVWLPFKTLYAKARKHREAEIERLKADPQAAIALDMEDRTRSPPSTFSAMPGSIKNIISRERWRKLVGDPPLPPVSTQPPRPPTPSDIRGPVGPAVQEPEARPGGVERATQFMHAVFSQPTFEPSEIFPTAFSEEMATDLARDAVFGFGSEDMPRQDATLATYQSNPAPAVGMTPSQPGTSTSESPLVNEIRNDNPPPWLWGESYHPPNTFPTNPQPAEAADVSMDENIDWQNFGENLRGLASSSTGGIWSSHI